MELIDYKAKDTIIGTTADKKDFIIRCCCNDEHTTYLFSRKVGYSYNLLKNLVEDFPDVILFKQELTPEELRSIELKPTIITDMSPRYTIVAFGTKYNIFKRYGVFVNTKFFIYERNKIVDENNISNFFDTIAEAISNLVKQEKHPITYYSSNLTELERKTLVEQFHVILNNDEEL